ncbi:beta strand repeat-containing protein [Hymenobacter negativus]|uniref:VCBS repeat-containing protein n=1 Tax=Hymenobacter negativus TaxID=2795026 RepID=A0ABS3QBF9_9BACT|nr:FG-GAP-like repeat-containing protein [Hymenobacter negativus]MBO2008303.1 VCBS repeat-containing protein [Hymenobacter negativus]
MSNTPATTCSGTLYDSGGATLPYSNAETFTKVLTPATAGAQLRLVFSSFDLESGYDFLTIYNGSSTSAPVIGQYTGTVGPGTVTASNTTGQLTLRFTSDVSVAGAGFAAAISCIGGGPTFTVTARTPASNSTNVAPTSPLNISFSESPTAASASGITVFGGLAGGRRALNAATVSGNTATVSVAGSAFKPGETVQVVVPATVRSSSGSSAVPYVYQFTTAASVASGRFGFRNVYATGNQPHDMVMGDVTGDGLPDIISGDGGDFTISVLPGLANGTFGSRQVYAITGTPTLLALGDVNNDGRLDVVTSNSQEATVSVLLATAAGGLGTNTTYAVPTGPSGIALGDLNGDGRLDMVVTSQGTTAAVGNTAAVLLNLGSGVFSTPITYLTGNSPISVTLGDLNNDGRLDMFTTNQNDNTVSVLLGTGTGSFGLKTDYTTGTGPFIGTLGDVNGDGNLDAVSGNNLSSTVTVRLGNGTGTLGTRTDYTTGSTPQDTDLGDVNGDGWLDIITANQGTGNISVLLNTGTGSFGTASNFAAGNSTVSTALADVNGDGRLDVAALNSTDQTVAILLGVGAPTITSFTPANGPVGTSVTITGTNLTGATNLQLNGATVTGFVVGNGGTTITFTIPAGASSGLLAVTTPGGTAVSATPFTVTAAQLTVSQGNTAYPSNGQAYSFGPQTLGVTSAPVTFTLTNPGSAPLIITGSSTTGPFNAGPLSSVTVPAGGTATVAVTFTPTTAGTQTGTLRLTSALGTYVVNLTGTGTIPVPVISGFSPASGPVGTVVTINGSGFSAGNIVTLNGTAVTGVTVSNGGTTITFTVPAGATAGPLTVTTAGGTATSSGSFCVQYVAIAPAATRCGAGSLTLTASGVPTGGIYTWYGQANGGTSLATGTSYTTGVLTGTTTYYVGISTGNGAGACEGPRTAVTATINALPVVTVVAGGPLNLCAGSSVVLTASGADTYQWSNGQTTTSITVSTAGSYSVTGLSAAGCAATSAATAVTITPLPAAPVATPASRCGSGSVTLSATGAPASGSYAWYSAATGGTALPGNTGATFTTPALTATTSYYVSALTAGGCEGPRTAVVAIINTVPIVTVAASGPLSFCQGGSVVLTASGADTYQWSTGQTTASITVASGGSYSVVGTTTAAGCSMTSPATAVTVNAIPAQPTITLGAGNVLTSSSATGNQWYLNGVAVVGATGATYAVATTAQQGLYTVVVTSAAGCVSPTSAGVQVVVTASTQTTALLDLHLYPNPAHGTATVQLPAVSGATTATLTVLDALGRVAQTRLVALPANGTRIELNLAGLASGVYALHVKAGSASTTKRFTVE